MAIDRLQGTDGIRGIVCDAKSCSSSDPISTFLECGILTEDFFELYRGDYIFSPNEMGRKLPRSSLKILQSFRLKPPLFV